MKVLNVTKVASLMLVMAATFFFSQNAYAQAAGDNVTVYNSFADATLTGGVEGFYGAAGVQLNFLSLSISTILMSITAV